MAKPEAHRAPTPREWTSTLEEAEARPFFLPQVGLRRRGGAARLEDGESPDDRLCGARRRGERRGREGLSLLLDVCFGERGTDCCRRRATVRAEEHPVRRRPPPDGGATWPCSTCAGVPAGVYHYDVEHHALARLYDGDHRRCVRRRDDRPVRGGARCAARGCSGVHLAGRARDVALPRARARARAILVDVGHAVMALRMRRAEARTALATRFRRCEDSRVAELLRIDRLAPAAALRGDAGAVSRETAAHHVAAAVRLRRARTGGSAALDARSGERFRLGGQRARDRARLPRAAHPGRGGSATASSAEELERRAVGLLGCRSPRPRRPAAAERKNGLVAAGFLLFSQMDLEYAECGRPDDGHRRRHGASRVDAYRDGRARGPTAAAARLAASVVALPAPRRASEPTVGADRAALGARLCARAAGGGGDGRRAAHGATAGDARDGGRRASATTRCAS